MEENKEHPHEISYQVNGETQTTAERKLTPVQIMQKAGINPAENYLVEIRGRERISYQSDPGVPIEVYPNEKFVTVYTGAVPVSCHG
jgi:hypothetical protein